jgi:hypothetical protein
MQRTILNPRQKFQSRTEMPKFKQHPLSSFKTGKYERPEIVSSQYVTLTKFAQSRYKPEGRGFESR